VGDAGVGTGGVVDGRGRGGGGQGGREQGTEQTGKDTGGYGRPNGATRRRTLFDGVRLGGADTCSLLCGANEFT
jgi:hypothetical protein